MSEHDSHEDAGLSALYRRSAQQEPSAQLDARVLATARRHAQRHSRRWWLPLSTAAVVVLAVSLLWRMELRPYELPPPMAPQLPQAPRTKEQPAAPAPAAAFEAKRKREAERTTDSVMQTETAAGPEVQDNAAQPVPPAKARAKAPVPLASTMAEEMAKPAAPETKQSAIPQAEPSAVPAARSAAAAGIASPQESVIGEAKMEDEAKAEAPETWLKRIETLKARGELEAARRELRAFRKVYPHYTLPRELQALLPEELK